LADYCRYSYNMISIQCVFQPQNESQTEQSY